MCLGQGREDGDAPVLMPSISGGINGSGRDEWGPDGKATPEAKRVDFRKFKGK